MVMVGYDRKSSNVNELWPGVYHRTANGIKFWSKFVNFQHKYSNYTRWHFRSNNSQFAISWKALQQPACQGILLNVNMYIHRYRFIYWKLPLALTQNTNREQTVRPTSHRILPSLPPISERGNIINMPSIFLSIINFISIFLNWYL